MSHDSVPGSLYHDLNPSGHWFDPETMRFFKTRIGAHVYVNDDYTNGDLLFITSEKPPHGPRAYAVRQMNRKTGDIRGEVREFATRSQALAAMRKRAKQ